MPSVARWWGSWRGTPPAAAPDVPRDAGSPVPATRGGGGGGGGVGDAPPPAGAAATDGRSGGASADRGASSHLITHTFWYRDGDVGGISRGGVCADEGGTPAVAAAADAGGDPAGAAAGSPPAPASGSGGTDDSDAVSGEARQGKGAADDEDEDEDGWSSADEDSELLRDDQTCLRGGDTAAPRTLIETLNSAALRRVLRYSGIAYSVAIVYAVVLIVLGHVYAAKVPLSQIFPGNDGLVMELEVLPPALMVVHMVIGVVLGVAIVCAAVALSAHVWAVPRARRADEQVWTIVLLWSAAIYAVPVTEYEALSLFRLFASPNNVEESGEASKLLFVFLSMGSVAFAAFILWYGSTSVASFRKLDGSNRRVRFYLPRTVLLVVHVALRINAFVSLPGTEVAFSVFPLASVAYLLRLVVARPVAAPLTDDPWSMAAAVVVITVEGVLVAVLLAEMRVTGYVLKQTSFVRTRRKHIAHRFYALHARRMALAASLCVLVTAVAPPIGLTIWLHREGVFLWLTEPLGHGPPFRLLVSTYVLVEALLALPPHVTGVRALFSRPQRLAKAGGEEEVTDECSSNASIASSKSSTPEGGGDRKSVV